MLFKRNCSEQSRRVGDITRGNTRRYGLKDSQFRADGLGTLIWLPVRAGRAAQWAVRAWYGRDLSATSSSIATTVLLKTAQVMLEEVVVAAISIQYDVERVRPVAYPISVVGVEPVPRDASSGSQGNSLRAPILSPSSIAQSREQRAAIRHAGPADGAGLVRDRSDR